jgi:hypothetical protein
MDNNEDDLKTLDAEALDERTPADEQPPPSEISREDLMKALAAAQDEADGYRKLLEETGKNTEDRAKLAERTAFLNHMRGLYEKDPISATDEMIRRAQIEVLDLVEGYVSQVLDKEQSINRLLGEFLNDPANAKLKPFKDELACLIGQKGMKAGEAASVTHRILAKHENGADRKRAAAQAIRNKATVESDGEPGEPADEDSGFAGVVKKSKNLHEMFAGLRKIKYL